MRRLRMVPPVRRFCCEGDTGRKRNGSKVKEGREREVRKTGPKRLPSVPEKLNSCGANLGS